jgi:predicted nucleic acid-binding protein
MTKALLDTNILSEIIKEKDVNVSRRARSYLAQHGRFTFSTISVMEVISGLSRRMLDAKIQQFVKLAHRNDVIPLDIIAAELAGRISADLLRAGTDIGVPDTMIAAIAIHRGIPLVTGNTSDYLRVQEAGYPLVLENWRNP